MNYPTVASWNVMFDLKLNAKNREHTKKQKNNRIARISRIKNRIKK
jgi:hypothetical protein